MSRIAWRITCLLAGLAFASLQGCGSGDSSKNFPSTTAAWYNHSLAFKAYSASFGSYSTANLYSWGYNAFGQLGIDSTSSKDEPRDVYPPSRFAGFSVGSNHTLAFVPFQSTNSVYAWGHNGYGQLGNNESGNAESSATPVPVNLPNVTAVAAGGYHSMALANYSSLYTWGNNDYGQLGNNSTADTDQPQDIHSPVLSNVKRIAAGSLHGIALRTDGSVWTWGSNNYGQIGNGTTTDQKSPVQVNLGGKQAKLIAAGGAFSVAVTVDDQIYAWGINQFGQLGHDQTSDTSIKVGNEVIHYNASPQSITIPGTVKALAAGLNHVLVMNDEGQIWAWGSNEFGQLGIVAVISKNFTPTSIGTFDSTLLVDGLSPILAVGHHSLAFKGRKLHAWGYNAYGQLGDGTKTDRSIPTPVSGF